MFGHSQVIGDGLVYRTLFYSSFNPLAPYFSFIWTSDLDLTLTIPFLLFLTSYLPFSIPYILHVDMQGLIFSKSPNGFQ
jgi:hypothetical protein